MKQPKDEGKAKPILCYVDGNHAYFTTQSLDKQWGDDWNDAPYEYNAGTPYSPYSDEDKDRWKIITLIFEGPFEQPCEGFNNSPYSVEDINNKQVPWLKTDKWVKQAVFIWAGTEIVEFCELIVKAGGKVYRELREGDVVYEV